jgi:uncharacterized membrane protein
MFEPLFLAAVFILPLVLSLVALSRARRLETELLPELNSLKEAVESLRTRLYELKKEMRAPSQTPEAARSSTPEGGPQASSPPVEPRERAPVASAGTAPGSVRIVSDADRAVARRYACPVVAGVRAPMRRKR